MTFLHILRKRPVFKICKLCRYNLILDLFTTKLATINWYSKCFHPICGCYLLKNSKFVWTRYSIYLLLCVFRRPLLFLSFYDHSHVALFKVFMFPDVCILLSDIKIMQKIPFYRYSNIETAISLTYKWMKFCDWTYQWQEFGKSL